ncbi:MAG TPA: hypothetical protein VFK79_09820 [Xanthobacteraceae bacterium]|nr:hypothetical protein [Xanthobacteraceae bacterium]
MQLVRSLGVAAAVAATSAATASPAESKAGKDELLTPCLLSVAADRCGFPMSGRQADVIDREADVAFERQGPAACDRNGGFAQGFRPTLQRWFGP